MSSPEQHESLSPQALETELPGVTVQDIDKQSLPALKNLFEQNKEYFDTGDFFSDRVYDIIERETIEGTATARRMSIQKDSKMVGFVELSPTDNPDDPKEVEVWCVVDEASSGQGIAGAAVGAVVEREAVKGVNLVAETRQTNRKVIRMLEALQFERTGYNKDDNRLVFARRVIDYDEMMRRFGL